MRSLLIPIIIFLPIVSFAQTEATKIFRKTDYVNGIFYRQSNDTIAAIDEPIDVYFFRRHFYAPYYLPEKFVDPGKKNKTISVWQDPNGKKDYNLNWQKNYIYDNFGRVTSYNYSGCSVCSNFPYSYSVSYNASGNVERIFDKDHLKDSFMFFYNSKGDIVKMDKFLSDQLELVIDLVN